MRCRGYSDRHWFILRASSQVMAELYLCACVNPLIRCARSPPIARSSIHILKVLYVSLSPMLSSERSGGNGDTTGRPQRERLKERGSID